MLSMRDSTTLLDYTVFDLKSLKVSHTERVDELHLIYNIKRMRR